MGLFPVAQRTLLRTVYSAEDKSGTVVMMKVVNKKKGGVAIT